MCSKKETKYLCSARVEAKERSWQNQRKRRREALKRKADSDSPGGSVEANNDQETNKKMLLSGKFTEAVEEVEAASSQTCDDMQAALLQEILSSEQGQKSVSNSVLAPGEGGESESLVLVCDLTVRWTGSAVLLELSYREGEAGREGTHQLRQFVKNKLASLS